MNNDGILIYWEKQEAGLCGVHCVNTLLQGPYVTEIELAQIALKLDDNEKLLMRENGTESEDFLKFMAEESGNVALDGNYSIQVLSEALKVWDLSCISITSKEEFTKDIKQNPSKQQAFICNLAAHWFTVRKIEGHWWNLNSLSEEGPTYVGELYLTAMLDTLVLEGYSIFVVQGNFPQSNSNLSNSFTMGRGKWLNRFPPGQKQQPKNVPFSTPGHRLGGTNDNNNNENMTDEDIEFQKILELSMQTAIEEKLKKIKDEPEKGKDITELSIQTPLGNFKRRFLKTDKTEILYSYLEANGIDFNLYKISINFSNDVIDREKTFEESKLHPRSALIVKKSN